MIITLVCSFFVTWICLPVIYLLLACRDKPGAAARLPAPHSVTRQRWVSFFIRRPWLSLIIVAALIVSICLVLPKLETGFLPEMDEGSIVLDYHSPPGTSLDETDRMLREVEKLIVRVPEVRAYSRRTGTQMGFFVTEPNKGDYLIQLKKDPEKVNGRSDQRSARAGRIHSACTPGRFRAGDHGYVGRSDDFGSAH